MLMIRLQRVGRVHATAFRLVLTDSKNGPKCGKSLEVLGAYDPKGKREIANLDPERIKLLIKNGAQLSDTVHNLLIQQKVITGKKRNPLPMKTPIKKEVSPEAAATAAATPAPAAEAPASPVEEAPKA